MLTLLLASCLACAGAFDTEAHDAAGQTTTSALDQVALKQVKRLLGGNDPGDVAGWGHAVDDSYPGMERLHFQPHTSEPWCGPVAEKKAKCEDNICLLEAIKHFYGKILADEGRKIDYPQIDYSKVAKDSSGTVLKFTDADAVKMLINLLGDLHQPMHVAWESDSMGKNVQVKVKGKQMSLYDLWDKGVSEFIRTEESNFWLGGWTHVSAIQKEFQEDSAAWKRDGAFKTFDRWMDEAVKFACETAYTHPETRGKLGGPDAPGSPVDIGQSGYFQIRQQWLRQVLLAGQRTAIVLNDILDAKGASKLSEGSQVHTKQDDKKVEEEEAWEKELAERKKKEPAAYVGTKYRGSYSHGVTNLMIAAVVVPMFIVVTNYGVDPTKYVNALSAWANAPKSSSGGGSMKRFD